MSRNRRSRCSCRPRRRCGSTAARTVLYLDFESDKESVVARLLELGAHPQAILDHFHYVRPEVAPDSSPQEQAAWQAVLSVRYTLAVIDSVTEALAVLAWSSINNDDLAAWSRMVPRRIADADRGRRGAHRPRRQGHQGPQPVGHRRADQDGRADRCLLFAGGPPGAGPGHARGAAAAGRQGPPGPRAPALRPAPQERPHPGGGPDRHRLHRRSHGHHRLAAGKRGRRRPGRRLPPHQR